MIVWNVLYIILFFFLNKCLTWILSTSILGSFCLGLERSVTVVKPPFSFLFYFFPFGYITYCVWIMSQYSDRRGGYKSRAQWKWQVVCISFRSSSIQVRKQVLESENNVCYRGIRAEFSLTKFQMMLSWQTQNTLNGICTLFLKKWIIAERTGVLFLFYFLFIACTVSVFWWRFNGYNRYALNLKQ